MVFGTVFAYLLLESFAADAPGLRAVIAKAGSVSDRLGLWGAAVSFIVENPLLGVGPANFAFHYAWTFGHPHNTILQIAAEYGLPFTFLLLCTAVRFLHGGARAVREGSDGVVDSAIYAAIMCGLIDSMFSGNNLMPHSQIVLVVLVAWFLARTATHDNKPGNIDSSNAVGLPFRGFACIVWGALLWAACSYYLFATSGDYALTTAGPRFWFDSRSIHYISH
jgi:O-antigen ligase